MKRRVISSDIEAALLEGVILEPNEWLVLRNFSQNSVEHLCRAVGASMKRAGRTGPEYNGVVICLRTEQTIESLPEDKLRYIYEKLKAKFEEIK